ncbi:MAG: hypothetical protein HZC41_03305 [Chloroflexi bacterium]|nr:hypothetical protein [Chloroflexota bacterium]
MPSFHPRQIVFEDRAHPDSDVSAASPFVRQPQTESSTRFMHDLARDYGCWSDVLSPEQTAYALAQVTAATVLPPLTRLNSGSELLDYRVSLREVLGSALVPELAAALNEPDPHWQQVHASGYACVIGAGVAAYLDITPGSESLSLRYANALVPVLLNARRAAELPRSRLFLQTALYERFDALLARARARAWFWLAG